MNKEKVEALVNKIIKRGLSKNLLDDRAFQERDIEMKYNTAHFEEVCLDNFEIMKTSIKTYKGETTIHFPTITSISDAWIQMYDKNGKKRSYNIVMSGISILSYLTTYEPLELEEVKEILDGAKLGLMRHMGPSKSKVEIKDVLRDILESPYISDDVKLWAKLSY